MPKAIIHHLVVDRAVRRGTDHRTAEVILGVLSASAELGVAAAFFVLVWHPPALSQLIGFGAGAGMAEAAMLPFIARVHAFLGAAAVALTAALVVFAPLFTAAA